MTVSTQFENLRERVLGLPADLRFDLLQELTKTFAPSQKSAIRTVTIDEIHDPEYMLLKPLSINIEQIRDDLFIASDPAGGYHETGFEAKFAVAEMVNRMLEDYEALTPKASEELSENERQRLDYIKSILALDPDYDPAQDPDIIIANQRAQEARENPDVMIPWDQFRAELVADGYLDE